MTAPAQGSWRRPVWGALGLLLAYYAFPATLGDTKVAILGLLLTGAGLGLVGLVLARELTHISAGRPLRNSASLSLLLVLLVMAFSLTFFLLDQIEPGQVAELDTRTDALYFTLSTMTTVGYGDVHAVGQLARGLTCCLIVFNVIVVSSLLRLHLRRRPEA